MYKHIKELTEEDENIDSNQFTIIKTIRILEKENTDMIYNILLYTSKGRSGRLEGSLNVFTYSIGTFNETISEIVKNSKITRDIVLNKECDGGLLFYALADYISEKAKVNRYSMNDLKLLQPLVINEFIRTMY